MNSLQTTLRTTSSGFTLIELMVTIAVMAIIVSIAAPSISTQLANQRVKSTAATLENALKEAKAESIIRRQDITLVYDNTSDPRVITTNSSGTNVGVISRHNYNTNSTIASNPTAITFEPSKRVSAMVTYTICDTNAAATSRVISVSRVANITNQAGDSC